MPIRVLFLEDNSADFELISEFLRTEGLQLEVTRAASRQQFETAYDAHKFDLVLSDYSIPGYSGFGALQFARATDPEIPFILLSGTLSEEQAVEGLKAGATDYIIKERLSRLGPAIRRALDARADRIAHAQAQKNLQEIEAQLLRAQRIQTIGSLSGGIAHDLNNALSPIIMAAEILGDDIKTESGQRMLDLVRTSAKRCADMVKQILSFSRGAGSGKEPLNSVKIIDELAGLARETFPRLITIHTRSDTRAHPFLGNVTQVHQVIMNLLINARDAMPKGGSLTISVRNVRLRGRKSNMLAAPATGAYIAITVADTGAGIPKEIQARIFEPFFTTKESGKGTGLGLSTVFSIVKNHNGFIEMRSEPGEGTVFEVYFPAEVPEVSAAEPAQLLPSARGERLLVVDDETGLLALLKNTLEALGYEVATASGGLEALAILESAGQKFDLVLTDWVMPILSGSDLVRRIRALAPDVKIVVVTGSAPLENDDFRAAGADGTLQKPYTTESLLAAITSALEPADGVTAN